MAELVGNETIADGCMVETWRTAQSFWRNGKRLIPVPIFNKIPYSKEILQSGLAKHKGARIYVNGSTVRFEWLAKSSTNGKAGGIASGRSRREKIEANAKRMRSECEPSSSSSSSSSSSNTNTGNIFFSDLKPAIEEWKTTLESFGIKKDPYFDAMDIQRLITRYGKERTLLALRGARLEPKTQSYDPGKHCSISRVCRPEVFDKFVNLGSQVPVKSEIKYNTSATLSETREQVNYDPSVVREIVRRHTGK